MNKLTRWFWRVLGRLAAWRFMWSNWLMFGYLGRGVHVYALGDSYVVEQFELDRREGVRVSGEAYMGGDVIGTDFDALKCALVEVAMQVGEPGDYRRVADLLFAEDEG